MAGLTPERKTQLQEAAQSLQIDISPIADDELWLLTTLIPPLYDKLRWTWQTWNESTRVTGSLATVIDEERIELRRMIPVTRWHKGMSLEIAKVADLWEPSRRDTFYKLTESGLGIVEVEAPRPEILSRRALRLRELSTVMKYMTHVRTEVEKHLGKGAVGDFLRAELILEEEFMVRYTSSA